MTYEWDKILKILLDEMYTGLKEYLEALRWEVLTVQDVKLTGERDMRIVQYAKENGLTLVTQDDKTADLADLQGVHCLFISNKMLARMIDTELGKQPNWKTSEG